MRRRRAYPALLAVMLLVVGQLAALAHQAQTRHVECDEHGEELEAATLAQALDACEHDHWIAVEDAGGGAHDDCAILRALHQSTETSRVYAAPVVTLFVTHTPAPPPARLAVTRELYLIAPKTSPPV